MHDQLHERLKKVAKCSAKLLLAELKRCLWILDLSSS